MIFRRRKGQDDETDVESGVDQLAEDEADADEFDDLQVERPHGPWDRDETAADDGNDAYIDLGGLIVKGAPQLELRLQIDDQGAAVTSVMLAGPDSGLELRAFAAPRSGGIWKDVLTDIAAEATKRGGTATEVDGEFGTELKLSVPIQTQDGRHGTQTSRVVGVDGPRWLLRGTFLGKSASAPDPDGVVEQAFRDVIVVRGGGPMAPRELIPMRVPPEAEGMTTEPGSGDEVGSPSPDDE